MLSVSITILTVLLVVVSLLMILLVLMQRPKQEGLGAAFGGGMMNDIAGAHTTDILQKGTVWLSVMFFSISILLGVLYTNQISNRNNVKVLDGVKQEQLPPVPPTSIGEFPPPPPITPEVPVTPPASEGETVPNNEKTPEPAAPEKPGTANEKSSGDETESPKTESDGSGDGKKKEPAESGTPQ